MSKRGEGLLEAGEVKIKWCGDPARFLSSEHHALDCDSLLYSHGHGSSRRFEGISPFTSLLPAPHFYRLPKAQRQQDPAQNSYELNPPQQTTNYGHANNQNTDYGNNSGNGTSDNFYDEVLYTLSSYPSEVLTQVSS